MNRNLFLLAAALQLPVTLWMQGCNKDADPSDDVDKDPSTGSNDPATTNQPDGEPTTTTNTVDVEDLNRNKKHKQTAQDMIDNESEIKFIVDEHYYNKDIVKPSAHIQMMDSERIAEDKKTMGYHLLGYEFDEWFTTHFEWQPLADSRRVTNRHQPAVIFDEEIMEEEQYPVVMNARKISNSVSTAATIIAYDVTPSGIKKEDCKQSFVLVTEVYTHRESTDVRSGKFNYPAGNNANVLNTFVPMAKVPDLVYDFCYQAMEQIFLFNSMMHNKQDEEQVKLFKEYEAKGFKFKEYSLDTFTVWDHLEDNRQNREEMSATNVISNSNIGAPFPGKTEHTVASLATAWDVIDTFIKDLDVAVDGFIRTNLLPYNNLAYQQGFFEENEKLQRKHAKTHTEKVEVEGVEEEVTFQRGDLIDGKTGDYVSWDKTNKKHYEVLASVALFEDRGLQMKLSRAVDMLKHVYSNDESIFGEDVVETIYMWSGNFPGYKEPKAVEDKPKERKAVQHHGHNLVLPKFFWERVISVKESAIPASRNASWVEFAEDVIVDSELPKYIVPGIKDLPGLDSYVIEDVYIHQPLADLHDNFLLAIMFGCYDAFTAAAGARYRGLPDKYVLADHGRRTNRRNTDRYNSVKRMTGAWDEKKMRPKKIIFTTPEKHEATQFRALLESITTDKVAPKEAVKSTPKKQQIRPMSTREFKIELEESTAPAA